MPNDGITASRDWLRSTRASLLAWLIPVAVLFAGLFAPVPWRTALWIIALIWMGTACMINARRCGRTHCRYTGPYFLAMTAPVLLLGTGVISDGIYGWLALGCVILFGSAILWWATERGWGTFS